LDIKHLFEKIFWRRCRKRFSGNMSAFHAYADKSVATVATRYRHLFEHLIGQVRTRSAELVPVLGFIARTLASLAHFFAQCFEVSFKTFMLS